MKERNKEIIPKVRTKKIKSDNFTRTNSVKSNASIAILERLIIGLHHTFIARIFGGTNNILFESTTIDTHHHTVHTHYLTQYTHTTSQRNEVMV